MNGIDQRHISNMCVMGQDNPWPSSMPPRRSPVAFSSTGDPEMGDYDDEPTVFFRKGQLPVVFD
jgi:hypothetical protein